MTEQPGKLTPVSKPPPFVSLFISSSVGVVDVSGREDVNKGHSRSLGRNYRGRRGKQDGQNEIL